MTYAFADTTTFSIDTGPMGTMHVSAALAGAAELTFRHADGRLEVIARFPLLRGTFENASQGAESVTEADVGGPFILSVSERGRVAVLDVPLLTPAFNDLSGPQKLPRLFFIQLPGRAVTVGESWIDTVATTENSAGTTSRAHAVVTTTLAGDTLIEGRRLLRLDSHSDITLDVSGVSGGVDIRQRLHGGTVGMALWDPARKLLVERSDCGRLDGTLEIPAADVAPFPVAARVRRSVTLGS